MNPPNLTSLERVKSWLGISSSDDDVLLSTIISASSRFVYRLIDIDTVAVTSYVERRDGYGNYWIRPLSWPLLSVDYIQYGGFNLTAQATGNPPSNGYTITAPAYGPARLAVHGYPGFPKGKDLIVISYSAGFLEEDEPHTIPATVIPPAIQPPYVAVTDLLWAGNVSVKTSLGVEMTQVQGSPGDGQYSVSSEGLYTFNAAQNGQVVLISYSYVPNDLAQATTELVGGTYKSKDQINLQSKSLGGQETVSYFQNELTPNIKMLLQPFMRVSPR